MPARQLDLLPPVGAGGEHASLEHPGERGEPGVAPAEQAEGRAGLPIERQAENSLRHPVERHQAPIVTGGEHSR